MANEMPPEYQVCTREQGEELSKRLGEHAPGSLWVWMAVRWSMHVKPQWKLEVNKKHYSYLSRNGCISYEEVPAYTGDELGALLPNALIHGNEKYWRYAFAMHTKNRKTSVGYAKLSRYDRHFDTVKGLIKESKTEAQAKADLAIQGLKEGWIKKEEFKYPDFD